MTEETKIDNETMTIRRNKDESTQNYKSRLQDLFEKNSEPKPL